MKGFKLGDQRGITLVELLVALGLVSMIGLGAAQLLSRIDKSDAIMNARTAARADLQNLFKSIERDLDYRILTPPSNLCNMALCPSFTIERSILAGAGSYRVTINSSCKSFPSGFPSHLQARFDQLTQAQSTCIRALNCPQGQYPEVAFNLSNVPAGAALPKYPDTLPRFQVNAKSVQKNTLGAGLCTVQSLMQGVFLKDRIIFETAYMGPEGQAIIERQEANFSSNPTNASMTLLPH